MYVCMYVCIEREREREREIHSESSGLALILRGSTFQKQGNTPESQPLGKILVGEILAETLADLCLFRASPSSFEDLTPIQ